MTSILAFAALLMLSAPGARAASEYDELLIGSIAAIVAEDWRTGASRASALLALPNATARQRAAGLMHLCIHLAQLGRHAQALRACDDSIALNPDDWGGYVNRGNVLLATGRSIAAETDYRKATELRPRSDSTGIAESTRAERDNAGAAQQFASREDGSYAAP